MISSIIITKSIEFAGYSSRTTTTIGLSIKNIAHCLEYSIFVPSLWNRLKISTTYQIGQWFDAEKCTSRECLTNLLSECSFRTYTVRNFQANGWTYCTTPLDAKDAVQFWSKRNVLKLLLSTNVMRLKVWETILLLLGWHGLGWVGLGGKGTKTNDLFTLRRVSSRPHHYCKEWKDLHRVFFTDFILFEKSNIFVSDFIKSVLGVTLFAKRWLVYKYASYVLGMLTFYLMYPTNSTNFNKDMFTQLTIW